MEKYKTEVVRVHSCGHVCVHVCTYVCMYVCEYMHVCMCIYKCMRLHTIHMRAYGTVCTHVITVYKCVRTHALLLTHLEVLVELLWFVFNVPKQKDITNGM